MRLKRGRLRSNYIAPLEEGISDSLDPRRHPGLVLELLGCFSLTFNDPQMRNEAWFIEIIGFVYLILKVATPKTGGKLLRDRLTQRRTPDNHVERYKRRTFIRNFVDRNS